MKRVIDFLKGLNLRYVGALIISVIGAFIIGALVMLITGYDPIRAYGAMISGVFSTKRYFGNFLEYAMVLCLCGLACVLGSRVGIFNVGGEGQMLLGAILSCQIGTWLKGDSPWLVIPIAAVAAMGIGAFYAWIPGVLKVKLKVNEVITTIMLNTIAAYFCAYLAKGPWNSSAKNMYGTTEKLGAQYWFNGLIRGSNLSSAIFAAAIITFLIWYIMEKTSKGYEMRMIGENPRFSRFSGLSTDRIIIVTMVVSGALCGLVGMFRVYGAEHVYSGSISNDYYFEALMVAMIAQYKPSTVIILSFFFSVLKTGSQNMQSAAQVPPQIYLIIQNIIIFFMAAETGISASLNQRMQKKKAKQAAIRRQKGAEAQ